uniref:Ig-like domain-containing protein n=1 Tax=Calidris pygmaea TaxID=425635 RepID=A0A8C3J8U7_9CHAR
MQTSGFQLHVPGGAAAEGNAPVWVELVIYPNIITLLRNGNLRISFRKRKKSLCQALVVPTEVSGRVGETLSIRCWYPRGYESYNKYWCRGGSRDSCHKVVETKGREVPWQHGRFSIKDNHVFCMVLLTVKNVLEVDAGSYWCGIERTGRDLMKLVTVRVVPGKPWCLAGWRFCWPGPFFGGAQRSPRLVLGLREPTTAQAGRWSHWLHTAASTNAEPQL